MVRKQRNLSISVLILSVVSMLSAGSFVYDQKPLLMREASLVDANGAFHEKIKMPSGLIDGSGHQLWSAAAYVNVCFRADLVEKGK